jgi:restriction endonuclease S subunit
MLKTKKYICVICSTKPDQLSHHKSHLETQKHKDKKELFELKLSKLSKEQLLLAHKTDNINLIVEENETNLSSEKKLINHNINNNDDIPNTMSQEMKDKIEQSNNVSNKEALRDKIHEIHNYLRNNGAGYGMNALKVFNLLYGLKKIEEKDLLDKVNLKRPDCEFSYLLKIANENKDEQLTQLILNNVSTSIYKSNISELLFYEIPTNIKSSVFAHLIKEIDKITVIEKTCNVLLSGKIYEYFIGRDESAISELGAYFTDRHIVDYIFRKLNPSIKDGSIQSMIDMFGGSGGFTTGYINFLNNKYSINWKKNINKIFHFDMNEDVVKSAGLEVFCLTGELPDMDNNLKYKNSFTDEFNNMKFMNVITNPPYGGDKTPQTDAMIKNKKIIQYIKEELLTLKDELKIKIRKRQLKTLELKEKQDKKDSNMTKVSVENKSCSQRIKKYAKDNKLSGNDKESSSLILIMDLVDVNGTAIGVLKEGVFFNKTYKDLRKCLIKNFNVREIISIPQDQFENTSTKTSIVIFDNTEIKTTNVKFYDLTVEKYTEDKFEDINDMIIMTEYKGDICGISDTLVSEATKDEILSNPIISLNSKDYNKKKIIVGEGYMLVKLGDICEFLPKSKRKASFGQLEGEYNFYTSSDTVQKCDIVDYKEECILIGTGGNSSIHIANMFSCSADNLLIKTTNNKMVYYSILSIWDRLVGNMHGSTIKHVTKDMLEKFTISIPKSKQKIAEWVDKISKPYDKKNKNEKLIMKLEEQIKDKIKDIGENEDCDEVELGSICDINPESLKKNQFSQINYIDISSVKEGKINNIQLLNENFPSRAQRIIKKNDILFSTVRPNLRGYTFINEEIKNGIATSGFAVIRSKIIHPKYIYSLLIDDSIIDFLMKNSTGTSYPAVNSSVFEKIKLKIPKNKKLIKDIDPLFQEIEKLQTEMKEAESQYKKLIKELSEEAIPIEKTYN